MRSGEFVDEEGERVVWLFDDELFGEVFEEVVDVFFGEVVFDSGLVL